MGLFGPKIEEMETRKDIAGLIQALGHDKPGIRMKAVEALGRVAADGEAWAVMEAGGIQAAIQSLNDSDTVRESATATLETLAGRREIREKVTSALVRAMDDPQWSIRYWTARLLRDKVRNDEVNAVVKAGGALSFVRSLSDCNIDVRKQAARALKETAASHETGAIEAIKGSGGIGALVNALGDMDNDLRRLARDALKEIGCEGVHREEIISELIKALGSSDAYERLFAAEMLGEFGDARAIKPLRMLLGEQREKENVRESAKQALKQISFSLMATIKDTAETMERDLEDLESKLEMTLPSTEDRERVEELYEKAMGIKDVMDAVKEKSNGAADLARLIDAVSMLRSQVVVHGDYVKGGKLEVRDSVMNRPSIMNEPSMMDKTSRDAHGGRVFKICPYCGEELELPETPVFCPFCTKKF